MPFPEEMPEPELTEPSTQEQELGRRLRRARRNAGFELNGAAAASGVSAVSIQKYESAKRTPTVHRLAALARVYRVSLDWLAGLKEEPELLPPGKVLVDQAKVDRLLGAESPGELLPLLNWRPGMFLALVEIPARFRIIGASEAMDQAVRIREHLARIAPDLVEQFDEYQVQWEKVRVQAEKRLRGRLEGG